MNINEIVADFQIIGHTIKKLELNNDFYYVESNDETIQREIVVTYSLSEPFDVEDVESIGGAVTLYIDTQLHNDERAASIHLEIEGGFVLNNNRDEDLLNNMLAVNGCAALYSISRGIISSITSQMAMDGTGTIMIPMINTFELKKEVEKNQENNH